jgi:Nucleotidyl transferase AbiEii toxin, Type IV TA system
VNRLRATVERAFADLSALDNLWAVVGGLAVSTYAEPRTTRDLDVVVAVSGDKEAEQIIWSLLQLGYSVVAAVEHTERARLATMRMQPPMMKAAIVDLLFASSGIEPEIAASATHLEILPGLSAPVASIGHLIAMKVLARDDRRRPQDWDDLRALTRLASQADLDQARAALELITERGFARDRELVGDFEALLEEFAKIAQQ